MTRLEGVRRRLRDRESQAGATLVESILVILLVGVVVLTLITGLLTSTVGARRVNSNQRASLAMTSFSDSIRDLPYLPHDPLCTPATDAQAYLTAYNNLPAAERTATAGMTVEILDIKYWDLRYSTSTASTTSVAPEALWVSTKCAAKTGAQRLTLRVTLRDGRPGEESSATAQVVKRSPRNLCPVATAATTTTAPCR